MEKEYHIVMTGNSLLSNLSKENKWELKPTDIEEKARKGEINKEEVISFINKNPKRSCAELNTILTYRELNKGIKQTIYLVGTDTYSNKFIREILNGYLSSLDINIEKGVKLDGFFGEGHDENTFKRDMGKLLNRLLKIIKDKINDGYEVYLNPTGGFKPHVVVASVAGFISGIGIYYMHEEFKTIIEFPRVLYVIEDEKERELIEILKDRKSGLTGPDIQEFSLEIIEKLESFNLINVNYDDNEKPFRIKLTEKGRNVVEKII